MTNHFSLRCRAVRLSRKTLRIIARARLAPILRAKPVGKGMEGLSECRATPIYRQLMTLNTEHGAPHPVRFPFEAKLLQI